MKLHLFVLLGALSALGLAEPSPKIAPVAREHGVEQARKLLSDRFLMSAYRTPDGALHRLAETDLIFDWLSRRFAGQDGEEIVFWNPEPAPEYMGDHFNPSREIPGYIRLAIFESSAGGGKRYLGFEELWRVAAYELISLRRSKEFEPTEAKVVSGELSKEEYVEAAALFEYQSHERLVGFYDKVWQPWAKSAGFAPDAALWALPSPTFQEWRAHYTDHAGYPWKPFEEIFDWLKKWGNHAPQPSAGETPTPAR